MPRFFFHIRAAGEIAEDTDGAELPDIAAANDEAVLAARELLADMLRRGEVVDGQEFVICDELGHEIATVPFRSVIRLA
jgi:hypothetical protein